MTTEVKSKEIVKRKGIFYLLWFPVIFLAASSVLKAAVFVDLVVYRICLHSLNINATNCSILYENSSSPEVMSLEIKCGPHASVIVMIYTLMGTLLSGLMTHFLGPWSDRKGRKLLLMACYTGFIIEYAMLTLMANWNINPWYLLLASIPPNIVGGDCALKLVLSCYITDTTMKKERGFQFTLLDAVINGGLVIGAMVGRLLFENYGHTAVFGIAAICSILALLWTYFLLPEPVKATSQAGIKDTYNISSFKKFITNFSKKRENFGELVVYLAIFTLTLNGLTEKGQLTIDILFVRAKLGWNVQQYSNFITMGIVSRIAGLCIVSLRGRFTGVPDTLLIGLALISALGGALTKSLAWQSWHMHFAMWISLFSGITEPLLRSIISQFVPTQDIGKIFARAAVLESLSSVTGTPLYTLMYSSYLPPIYPSPVYILSVVLYIVLGLSVIGMEVMIRKSRKPPIYIAAAQEDLST